jgi:hypothetical protein
MSLPERGHPCPLLLAPGGQGCPRPGQHDGDLLKRGLDINTVYVMSFSAKEWLCRGDCRGSWLLACTVCQRVTMKGCRRDPIAFAGRRRAPALIAESVQSWEIGTSSIFAYDLSCLTRPITWESNVPWDAQSLLLVGAPASSGGSEIRRAGTFAGIHVREEPTRQVAAAPRLGASEAAGAASGGALAANRRATPYTVSGWGRKDCESTIDPLQDSTEVEAVTDGEEGASWHATPCNVSGFMGRKRRHPQADRRSAAPAHEGPRASRPHQVRV